MTTKRMKLKILRRLFIDDVKRPLRLNPEEWRELLTLIFREEIGTDETTALMKQAGYPEKRRAKGCFYVRPARELLEIAGNDVRMCQLLNDFIR